MFIQCLIKRDGPTEMSLAGQKIIFEKNKRGDYVAEVSSSSRIEHLLALSYFVEYKPEKQATKSDVKPKVLNPKTRGPAKKKKKPVKKTQKNMKRKGSNGTPNTINPQSAGMGERPDLGSENTGSPQ